jgi:TolB protein
MYRVQIFWLSILIISLGACGVPSSPSNEGNSDDLEEQIVYTNEVEDGTFEIFRMNPDGTDKTQITQNGAVNITPRVSPDGTQIAFHSNLDGNFEIYTIGIDGSGMQQITYSDSTNFNPSWTSNGQRLVFASNRDGDFDIYSIGADGNNLQNITDNDILDFHPEMAPNESRVAFTTFRGGQYDIYTIGTDGNDLMQITDSEQTDTWPSWSPDGSQIAYSQIIEDGNSEIFRKDSRGAGAATRITFDDGIDEVAEWSPDGNVIIFHSTRSGDLDIFKKELGDDQVIQLTDADLNQGDPHWTKIKVSSED